MSKRGQESDRNNNWDLYAIAAQSGAKARQLTTFIGPDSDPDWDSRPVWSPDGMSISYLQGGSPKLIEYAVFSNIRYCLKVFSFPFPQNPRSIVLPMVFAS